MNYKFLFAIIIVAISKFVAYSDESKKLLQLYYTDGNITEVNLHTHPTITFDVNEIRIDNSDTSLSILYDDLLQLGYVLQGYSGIGTTDVSKTCIRLNGNMLSYDFGAKRGEMTVYNLAGEIIRRRNFTSGIGSISIAGLPQGVYIARANSSTFKFRVNE